MRRLALKAAAGTAAAVLAAAGGSLAASAAPATGQAAAATAGPKLGLLAVQRTITVEEAKGFGLFLDPNVYVVSYRSALHLVVQRSSYTTPVRVTQLIATPSGLQRRALPNSIVATGWQGLRHFVRVTVANSRGHIVYAHRFTFCPDGQAQRASPDSPMTDPFPQSCGPFDPFPRGEVWGLPRNWGVDQFGTFLNPRKGYALPLGKYVATVAITPPYRTLLHISARAATATVHLNIVAGNPGCGPFPCSAHRPGAHPRLRPGTLPTLPAVPLMTRPPRSALPQLTALPSWGISTSHAAGNDWLNFGATVWIGGNSPLDVEGFHQSSSTSLLTAYQYFWRNGKVVGRARVGTMGFDNQPSHFHWHFEQFAQYRLLTATRRLAVRSHKVGFCIAPTDNVDMALRHAAWQPSYIGLSGQCGTPGALWVQEYLPIGWGDTYDQFKAGNAFNITNVPNGVYYVEIIANPLHKLYELSTAGNISLREVILGGTKGHRTVLVPAWHGIDPEH